MAGSGTLPHPGWNSHPAHSCDSALTAGSGGRSYCLAGTFPHSACEHIEQPRLGQQGKVPGQVFSPPTHILPTFLGISVLGSGYLGF